MNEKKGDELAMKIEWIHIKKKIGSLSDYHPSNLNIDTIMNFPLDLKVFDNDHKPNCSDNKNPQLSPEVIQALNDKENEIK